ncbi:type I-E CRISPR-associated protein Cse2/CasB [Streptomyces phytohabitans]|uniref:type I-E CRISPR-associated protein Cse2/CasB n=1 Tax=Streptomyces phytohabitans TaxID=1150371 RepID=UPI00345BCEC4
MAPHTPIPAHAPGPDGRLRPLPGLTVSRVVGKLQSGYRQDAPWAVASVARLRREAGREAHVSPTAWGLDHLELLAELRDERRHAIREARRAQSVDPAYLSSRGYVDREREELREDNAVHVTVTLWALHQQSLRDEAMHLSGWGLGRAVRRLAHGGAESEPVEEVSEPVRRRFVRVGSASDTEVLAGRLRELVLLLRTARIPLDYARLADQLMWWQDENQRDTVRRAWGRDFHRRYRSAERTSGGAGENTDPDDGPVTPEELDVDA